MGKFTPSLKSVAKNLPRPRAAKRATDCTNVEVGHVVFHPSDLTVERGCTKNSPPSLRTYSISEPHLTKSSTLVTDTDLSESEYLSDVDCISEDDSYGIKVLHNPEEASIVDIVFVHGLTGNSFHTWFDRTSQTHWPRDLIKEDLPDARVMTFGYDADVVHAVRSVSLESISSYSGDLLASLSGKRHGVEASRKIIFVAHSLGGIVVKKALAMSSQSPLERIRQIEASTSGIVFLGTPHHGSDLTKWAVFFSSLLNLAKPTNRAAVKILRKDSEVLGDLQEDFHTLLERRKDKRNRITVVCFYETLLTCKCWVVPKDSAVIHGEVSLPIHANHQNIAIVSSPSQKSYKDIMREIINIVDNYPCYSRFWAALPIFNLEGHLNQTSSPLSGTFEWIPSKLFPEKSCSDPPARLIRITGKPGCAKTTIAALLFRHLSQHRRERIIFFAFSGSDVARRSPSNMMAALIDQLGSTGQEQRQLNHYIMTSFTGGRVPADIETRCFTWLYEHLALDIVFVIDALDECDAGAEREGLVGLLATLIKTGQAKQYRRTFILLNRDHYDLSFEEHDIPKDCVTHLNLDKEDLMHTDLKAFTKDKIRELVKFRPAYRSYHKQLVEKVYERASNGMFLMVVLVVELLYRSSDSSKRGIDKTIGTLPSNLQEVYQRYWDAIEPVEKSRAAEIMTWIVTAVQPFHPQTLADAVAHERLHLAEDEVARIEDLRPMDLGGDLKRLFGPLIQVSEKVELIHQTVKEFFLNRESDCHEENQLLPHDRNIHIALICLFCLIRNRTNGSYHASSLNTILRVRIPPFYPYAKAYCIDHRQAAGGREENDQRIQEFDMSVQRSGVTIRSP